MGLTTVLILTALLLAAGCKKESADGAKSSGPSDAKGGAEGKPGVAGECGTYAEKLCEVVDPKSQTCENIKSTLELIPAAACKAGMSDLDYSKQKHKERAKVCQELVDKLCKDIGPETQTCEMVKSRVGSFPPQRCESMMGNYDKILADLQRREAANKPLNEEQQKMIASGEVMAEFGPKDAKVTVVEFSDFECPYCSRSAKAVSQIKEKYSDKVRVIFRHFPLSFHKKAHLASQASLAALSQGKFWEYHDKLFENQKALDRPELEKYATELGLNLAKFKTALDKEENKKAVDDDMALGQKVNVSGTPTIFLNGERVQNPTDFNAISQEIDKALGK